VKNYYINLEENDENDNKPTPFYGGTKVEPKWNQSGTKVKGE